MNRISKAQKLVEEKRVEMLINEPDLQQFVVSTGQNKQYLVNCSYGVWKCQEICGDWHHRGKDGQVEGSYLCKHILACLFYLFNERVKGQTVMEDILTFCKAYNKE